jgi:hypothetical protein
MELTKETIKFLDSRGGRTAKDIEVDEKGLYILMGSGSKGKDIKVRLPIALQDKKV